MKLKIKSFHELDLLDDKEMVKIYDCKTEEVIYDIGRWEFFRCDDLYDKYKDRNISYLGSNIEGSIVYLDIYLS